MLIIEHNDKVYRLKNTLCREGAFYFLQGPPVHLQNQTLLPITGGPVSFFDTIDTHPNWSFSVGFSTAGLVTWLTPAIGSKVSTATIQYNASGPTTVNGFALSIPSGSLRKLFAAALLPTPIPMVLGDSIRARFIYEGINVFI